MEVTVLAAVQEIAKRPVASFCESCEQTTAFEDRPGSGPVCVRCGALRDATVPSVAIRAARISRRK